MTDIYFLFYDNELFGVYQGYNDLFFGESTCKSFITNFNSDLMYYIAFSYDDAFYITQCLLNMF